MANRYNFKKFEGEEPTEKIIEKIVYKYGPPGPKGEIGQIGEKGEKGSFGQQGYHGKQGCKGEKGEMGTIGLDGIKGEKGTKGTAGLDGINSQPFIYSNQTLQVYSSSVSPGKFNVNLTNSECFVSRSSYDNIDITYLIDKIRRDDFVKITNYHIRNNILIIKIENIIEKNENGINFSFEKIMQNSNLKADDTYVVSFEGNILSQYY